MSALIDDPIFQAMIKDFELIMTDPVDPPVNTDQKSQADRLQKELLNDLSRILGEMFAFMAKYDEAKKKHPGFKIAFIEKSITITNSQ